jgi:hypothetical protein
VSRPTWGATIEELHHAFARQGLTFGLGSIQRFFARHGITRKKRTSHAAEQDRCDILRRRRDWFEGQLDLEPQRLVFIDETWASTNMARRRAMG